MSNSTYYYNSTPRRNDSVPLRSPRIPRKSFESRNSIERPSVNQKKSSNFDEASVVISQTYMRKLKYRLFSKSLESSEKPSTIKPVKTDQRQLRRLYRNLQVNMALKEDQLREEQSKESKMLIAPKFESLINSLKSKNAVHQLGVDYASRVEKFGGDLNLSESELNDPIRQDNMVKVYFDAKIKQANYNINAYLTHKHETFYNHGILLIGDIAKDLHELYQKMNIN